VVSQSLLQGRQVDGRIELEIVKTMILIKQVYGAAFAPYGVETTEWHALLRLAEADGCSQSELGQRLLRDKVAITRLVAGLQNKGLIKRKADPKDMRKQRIFLTSRAKRLIPELLSECDSILDRASEKLSERDKAALRRILPKLQGGLRTIKQSESTKQSKRRMG
jgi:DNA-binding MarR family transcriptional regulator